MDEIHLIIHKYHHFAKTEVEKGAITFGLYIMIIYQCIKCKLYNPSELQVCMLL